ncbi:MAG: ABC transporter ATP-binding protein [Vicinamibacterales bacterium]
MIALAQVPAPASPLVSLQTRDLTVGYRTRGAHRVVLEHLNLAARAGELVCVLGPNGSGKSTLLRTFARMQPPLSGQIELDGLSLAALTQLEVARRLSVVLADRVLVEALPARRVVELGRYAHSNWFGHVSDEDKRAVDWAIDVVGAAAVAERDFLELSDGERQRILIARALAQQPHVLLLDEPAAFLDLPSRIELMTLLRRLTRRDHLAVIVSTHDLETALRIADVLWLIMPNGELAVGAPEDVVMSGGIARAFEGRHLRFSSEGRTFSWLTAAQGSASVRGAGLSAAMATAVLEREGYCVVDDGDRECDVRVDVNADGWSMGSPDGDCSGTDYASLAASLRGRTARP